MAIEITCPKCSKRLRAPETHIGKKTRCPQCQEIFVVTAEGVAATAAQSGRTGRSKSAELAAPQWTVLIGDGSQFGPIPKAEVDAWVAEGRIDSQCQLLQEGWEQWKWADEIYPQLATGAMETAAPPAIPAPAGGDDEFRIAPVDSPFGAFTPASTPAAAALGVADANPYAGTGKARGLRETPAEMEQPAGVHVGKREQNWIAAFIGCTTSFYALIAEGIACLLLLLITLVISSPDTAPSSAQSAAFSGIMFSLMAYLAVSAYAICVAGWAINWHTPAEAKSNSFLRGAIGCVGGSILLAIIMMLIGSSVTGPSPTQMKKYQERITKAKNPGEEAEKVEKEIRDGAKTTQFMIKFVMWAALTASLAAFAMYALYLGALAKFFHRKSLQQQTVFYAGFIGAVAVWLIILIFVLLGMENLSPSTGKLILALTVLMFCGACGWLAFLTIEPRKYIKQRYT